MARRTVLGLLAGTGAALLGTALAGDAGVAAATTAPPLHLSGGLAQRLREVLSRSLLPTPEHPRHPSFPGAVALATRHGRTVAHLAVGDAVRYGADGALLPPARRVPATPQTIYDLASLTKVFTAVLVLRLVERDALGLDDPVPRYLPEFANKPAVTVRMLLTHTSGFAADGPLAGTTRAERLSHLLRVPLSAPAGTLYRYADMNFIALGTLLERLSGQRLDALVAEQVTGPLGMRDTMYRPPRELWPRVAATQGARRGVVHDPAAYALDGVAGHAGLFATAYDLGLLVRALTGGGLLLPATLLAMRTNQNVALGPSAAHGLGVDVAQPWYMGRLASDPGTFGHTGFTGTSFVVDPVRGTALVLLTNRIHPDPAWGGINPARRQAADVTAAL